MGDTLEKQGQRGNTKNKRDNSSEKQGFPAWGGRCPWKGREVSSERMGSPREVRRVPQKQVSPEKSKGPQGIAGSPQDKAHPPRSRGPLREARRGLSGRQGS